MMTNTSFNDSFDNYNNINEYNICKLTKIIYLKVIDVFLLIIIIIKNYNMILLWDVGVFETPIRSTQYDFFLFAFLLVLHDLVCFVLVVVASFEHFCNFVYFFLFCVDIL